MDAHHRLVHDERDSLSTRVVTMVAERKGVDPIELTPPLHSVIDPDALEALFSEEKSGFARVQFTYNGVEVSIQGDDTPEIEIV